jgi:prepilin signal peptidase PulO-like enzyme (type II secretory pathway)
MLPTAIIFFIGLLAGCAANWLIYTVAYFPRPIGPWRSPHPQAPPRKWIDYLPIIGWWTLRREASIHGSVFWVRPLLIEFGLGLLLVWLYHYELRAELLPLPFRAKVIGSEHLLWNFWSHAFLIFLMTVATFIDFDEQTIPDWVTLPGTILGLVLASMSPLIFLPIVNGQGVVVSALLTAPHNWQPGLQQRPHLWIGLLIVMGWAFALLDRRLIFRKGWRKAIEYFFARIFRHRFWMIALAVWLVMSIFVIWVWSLGGAQWQGLYTALVGLALGAGTVWSVRLIAGWALGVEAMGFGDVLLMAMVGTYIGWQASIIAFFIAPLTALFIVLAYWMLTGERRVAFGPYLCAGTLMVIVLWNYLWNVPHLELFVMFVMPKLLAAIFVFALIVMAMLLRLLRLLRGAG